MVIYPEVQLKAQAEIDRVVGKNRLPTFEDVDALPYVFAVFMETLRWHTVTPQGRKEIIVFAYAKLGNQVSLIDCKWKICIEVTSCHPAQL